MVSRFIVYRSAWRLTWLGRLLGLVVLAGLVWGGIRAAYPFLAPNRPLATDCLVVEGWLPDSGLRAIAEEVGSGRYSKVYLTGGPIYKNDPGSSYGSFPQLMKAALVKRGARADLLTPVPAPEVAKDRTYASGAALHDWMRRQHVDCPSFNLITQGPHARRSRLLFGKAFGDQTRIGVIPVTPDDYDSDHWWRTSSGVRDVVGEAIAYVYARFFFYP